MSRYNLVILPAPSGQVAGDDRPHPAESRQALRYIFSAGSKGRPRLVSGAMTLEEVRRSLGVLGLSGWQMEELLRGNRMAKMPRTTGYLSFEETRLLEFGLEPVVEEADAPEV